MLVIVMGRRMTSMGRCVGRCQCYWVIGGSLVAPRAMKAHDKYGEVRGKVCQCYRCPTAFHGVCGVYGKVRKVWSVWKGAEGVE